VPISFDFESPDGLVIATGEGLISIEDVQNAGHTFWGRMPGPRYPVLWDLRAARFDLDAGEIRELAVFAAGKAPSGSEVRSAYVVSGDLEFGLLRVFEMVREPQGVKTLVTRDMQAAIDWLGRTESDE